MYGVSDYALRTPREDRADVIFGLSDAERAYMDRNWPGIFAGGRRRFYAVGFPKADALARGDHGVAALRRRLGFAHDRPVVLMVSHWTPSAILHTYGARLVERLARRFPEIEFIQTGHNIIWDAPWIRSADYPSDKFHFDARASRALWDELVSVAQAHSNVRIVRTTDVESLMAIANLLVVDHSSALSTFTLMDRPILQFQSSDVRWFDSRVRDLCASAAHGFQTIEEIEELLPFALANPQSKAAGRRIVREHFLANSGRAAEVAIERLQELLGIGTVTLNDGDTR